MDSQGAGFAFDMNMDFSNVFATKPNEGNTSNDFFFGDEGIDATTTSFGSDFDLMNPALLTTAPQEQSYVPQNLTMDNTLASTSMWTGQLTPQSQNIKSFPPTPVQSFDTMYEQTTTLGKRALQLDVEDFPQAKRHETIDYTAMFSPSSSWTLDTQLSPPSAVAFGLSDEAADMCAMWFNKYAILPSDRHINSLSQLTGESADAIRHWFGRLLKQGMGSSHGDSAYKSQTALAQPAQFWNNYSTDIIQMPQIASAESTQEAMTTPEMPCADETATTVQLANALRGGKKQRCSPTEDRSLLSRDSNKVYQCTRKCGKRYGRKCDWKRNEEEGYPCKSWVCSLCTSQGVENVKACFRKYHFAQHFRNIHPGMNCDDYEETSFICSETDFPRQCGFCKHRFDSRQERIDHIADHFKQGKCMLDWNDGGGDDGADDSDDANDDDDRPHGDGFDSNRSSYKPPDNAPHGGSNSKYYGGDNNGDGNGDGNGGSSSGGGFFQFQLSQLARSGPDAQSSCTKQHIKSTDDSQRVERCSRAASEPLHQHSIGFFEKLERGSERPEPDTTTKCDQVSLARDAIPRSLTETHNSLTKSPAALEAFQMALHLSGSGDAHDEVVQAVSPNTSPDEDIGELKSLAGTLVPLPPPLSSNTTSSQSKSLESKAADQILQSLPTNSQSFLSVKLLGSGGFSTVDEVVHCGTNLRLARKTLKNRDPTAIKELLKEVDVLQKLRHPHVIRFLGAYSKGDKMSILLSPVADTTLAVWLDRIPLQKPANLAKIITKMFGCLASSVRYLHAQRPVVKHMDIKPQNILVVENHSEFPHVFLCDFGISSEGPTEEQIQPLTRHYVAPEVFEGFTRKQAADIWSLGCVFAEMASASYSQSNTGWLNFRREFNGRTGKHYWQDVSGLQDKLTTLLEEAATPTETSVVRTIKYMLDPQPAQRPDAASLTLLFTPAPCCLSWPNDKATYPGPREELNSMEVLLHEDSESCADQHDVHSLEKGSTSERLSNAKDWLQQCSHAHDACHQSDLTEKKTLPTRLIDMQPDDQDKSFIRIVDSAAIDTKSKLVEYIALSHIWSHSNATLNSDSLQAMKAHLPRELISEALNAAITTAQGLGYRYIWVDSLCVLQDNEDDKHQECMKMASVFRNAAVTLILDQIDDSLNATQQTLIGDSQTAKEGRIAASTALPVLDFTTPGFAWDTRAWALQERLLSHRFLHLGQEQMYWECNALKASDTFPQGLSSLIWEKVHSKLDNHTNVLTCHKHDSTPTHATSLATGGMPGITEHASTLEPRRLRNCQWIKIQGDGIGDSMEAVQTSLKVDNNHTTASTSNVYTHDGSTQAEQLGGRTQAVTEQPRVASSALSSSKSTKTTRPQTHRRRSPRIQHSQLRFSSRADRVLDRDGDDDREYISSWSGPSTPTSSLSPSSSSSLVAADMKLASARQDMSASGQMDQNGSMSRINAIATTAEDVDRTRARKNSNKRTRRDDCREIWHSETRAGWTD